MRPGPHARRVSSIGAGIVALVMFAACQATALAARPGAAPTADPSPTLSESAAPSFPPPATEPAPTPSEATPSPASPSPADVRTSATPSRPSAPTTLAFVTDFGLCTAGERQIATMVTEWKPDAVISGGDNSQGGAGCKAFTQSVADYYGGWMNGPQGPRFWPAIGNHDYSDETAGLPSYQKAFPYLPKDADKQGRWYAKTIGRVTFYFIDSNTTSPVLAEQRLWLKGALRANAARSDWQIVVMHHPPYTTGAHDFGTDDRLDLRPGDGGFNYKEWGADLVIAGHQHIYEDVVRNGFHYLTAGVGAQELARQCPAARIEGSRVCLENAGAIRIVAQPRTLSLEYRQPTVAPAAGTANEVTDIIVLRK